MTTQSRVCGYQGISEYTLRAVPHITRTVSDFIYNSFQKAGTMVVFAAVGVKLAFVAALPYLYSHYCCMMLLTMASSAATYKYLTEAGGVVLRQSKHSNAQHRAHTAHGSATSTTVLRQTTTATYRQPTTNKQRCSGDLLCPTLLRRAGSSTH